MEHEIVKIGVREFRNNISQYLSAETLAVTNHGRTVGYYIPVPYDPAKADLTALQEAAHSMATLLAQHSLTEDAVIAAFRQAREGSRRGE